MKNYKLFIERWALPASLGVTQDERGRNQTIVVNGDWELAAAAEDRPRFMDYGLLMDFARELASAGFPTVENICFCFTSAVLLWPDVVCANVEVLKEAYKVKVACSYPKKKWIGENPGCEAVIDHIKEKDHRLEREKWLWMCRRMLQGYLKAVQENEAAGGSLTPEMPWGNVLKNV